MFNGVAKGQTAMNVNEAQKIRYDGKVAICYFTHYETSFAHDWDLIKELNGPYRPTLGDYKTDDPQVVRQHLQGLRRAGVDVLLVDTTRVEQGDATLLNIGQQKSLQVLADQLAHQENESRKLQMVVWLEKWNGTPKPEHYRFALDYVRTNLAHRDFYFQFRGKPLVVAYFNTSDPAEIQALNKVDEEFQQDLTIRRINSGGSWGYIGPAGNQESFVVNPGSDPYMEVAFIQRLNGGTVNVEELRKHRPQTEAAREDGRLFERQLIQARAMNPEVLLVSGWNDWCYCLQIEPAVEYGFLYVDMLARLLGREAETKPYRQAAP